MGNLLPLLGIRPGQLGDRGDAMRGYLLDRTWPAPGEPARNLPGDQPRADTASSSLHTDVVLILERLRNDPALRFSETGRAILRQLYRYTVGVKEFGQMVEKIPAHRITTIAKLARANAEEWQQIAHRLERHSYAPDGSSRC